MTDLGSIVLRFRLFNKKHKLHLIYSIEITSILITYNNLTVIELVSSLRDKFYYCKYYGFSHSSAGLQINLAST